MLNYFLEKEENVFKTMTFLVWDIARFYDINKSFYVVTKECHLVTDDYEKIMKKMDKKLIIKWKFIDFEENYDIILKIFDIIIKKQENLKKERREVLWKKFEELNISHEVYLWKNEEGEEIKYINEQLDNMLKRWRSEWELAWKEKKRNYGIKYKSWSVFMKKWRRRRNKIYKW